MRDPLFWDYLKSDFQSQLWSATATLIYFAYIIWHDITAVARFCGDIIVCLLSNAQWHAIVFKSNHATRANKLPLANPQNWMWMQIVPLRDQYCSRFFFQDSTSGRSHEQKQSPTGHGDRARRCSPWHSACHSYQRLHFCMMRFATCWFSVTQRS